MEPLSLSELAERIKNVFRTNFSETIWVKAEIIEFSESRTGHAYMELGEKDKNSEKLLAKARATIWYGNYRIMKTYFKTVTGYELSAGIKVLFGVTAEYHELYGFSLNIVDIDPVYTLGDLQKQKNEIIEKLKNDGIFEMNKELAFPEFPQNIAIISSPSAAGYGDFVHQLKNNQYNFRFKHKLFSALMQGDQAEDSIIQALDNIYYSDKQFDLVIIIRGGGSKADLSVFDKYLLASNIAQFPIPVITGIGHERDESVCDLVANQSLKTPTAVAEFLIGKFLEIASHLNFIEKSIYEHVNSKLLTEKNRLQNIVQLIKIVSQQKVNQEQNRLDSFALKLQMQPQNTLKNQSALISNIENNLYKTVTHLISERTGKLNLLEKQVFYLNPENILKRGYTITYQDGKIVKNIKSINNDFLLKTQFYDGVIVSRISDNE